MHTERLEKSLKTWYDEGNSEKNILVFLNDYFKQNINSQIQFLQLKSAQNPSSLTKGLKQIFSVQNLKIVNGISAALIKCNLKPQKMGDFGSDSLEKIAKFIGLDKFIDIHTDQSIIDFIQNSDDFLTFFEISEKFMAVRELMNAGSSFADAIECCDGITFNPYDIPEFPELRQLESVKDEEFMNVIELLQIGVSLDEAIKTVKESTQSFEDFIMKQQEKEENKQSL